MELSQIKSLLSGKLTDFEISRVVRVGDSLIVTVCDTNGDPLFQPPYRINNGAIAGYFNLMNRANSAAYKAGEVLYSRDGA